MNLVIPLNEICEYDRQRGGGKASALAMMARSGMDVTVDGYLGIVTIHERTHEDISGYG